MGSTNPVCSLHNLKNHELPAAALFQCARRLLIFIVHVEEQQKGLDNPSFPPYWCIQAHAMGLNMDRHLFCAG